LQHSRDKLENAKKSSVGRPEETAALWRPAHGWEPTIAAYLTTFNTIHISQINFFLQVYEWNYGKFSPVQSDMNALFQASATKQMRTALLWAIMQRVVVIPYRRFGTTYRSHLQG